MRDENTLALFPEAKPVSKPLTNDKLPIAHQGADQSNTGLHVPKQKLHASCIWENRPIRGSKNAEENQLLTVNEFADQLRVTRACVRKWILLRKVGVVKVGRLVRLRASELRRIVEEGSRPPLERR
jgi:excisionase family DNA binding protein